MRKKYNEPNVNINNRYQTTKASDREIIIAIFEDTKGNRKYQQKTKRLSK